MGKIYEALERAKRSPKQDVPSPQRVVTPSLPKSTGGLVVLEEPGSPTAECFRFLRSVLVRPMEGDPPRTILVTSPLVGDGKTYVASNLSAAISQGLDEWVLLMDCDLRYPRLDRIFGLNSSHQGLSTYLTNDTPLDQLLKKTAVHKLTLLPGGNSTRQPTELLTSEKMLRLIREVRDRYEDRFVVMDSTPLELAPETFVIANEVDAVILVVRRGRTPRNAVRNAVNRIRRDKLLGVVFNDYDKSSKVYRKYEYTRVFGEHEGEEQSTTGGGEKADQ
ncbi:capsular exopolysaccharide family [Desulfacinum hydrothermale DSM 13146]|uniref:Capsular exopolysaccharide family n=1 Tax=Desulfacinum hydrothermale DSM 13146 TaxID=1121390 RepID=A0A1W1XQZ5_9BACT|nr:CpsD/CapB family tyrosine-protein kinase [Desulfacinum hydrothermale]SMC26410.1 capsular exopolysaccharide family [Desulfacinum hydrothermale DSM 13146]